MTRIKNVIKRSGAVVPFTPERISNAIYRAAVAVGGRNRTLAEELAHHVVAMLENNADPGATARWLKNWRTMWWRCWRITLIRIISRTLRRSRTWWRRC